MGTKSLIGHPITKSKICVPVPVRAELVAERVGDYVVYCTPDRNATEAQEFREGAICLSNCVHEEYSVVDVTSGPNEKGFLLEVASAMTGLGVTIHEAIVQVVLPS